MKKYFILPAIASLLGLLLILTGCDRTGDLTVVVENELGTRIANKPVYLYVNQTDFNNAVYTKTATTDSEGKATFYELDPQTYWLDCDFTLLGIDYVATGTATVEKGMITTVVLTP